MAVVLKVLTGIALGAAAAAGSLGQLLPSYYTKAEVDEIVRGLRESRAGTELVYTKGEVDSIIAQVDGRVRAQAAATPRITVHTAQNRIDTHLFYNERVIPGFTTVIQVSQPGVALIDFHCDVVHRGLVNGVVGVGARLWYRRAHSPNALASSPPIAIAGAVTGANIVNLTHHYGQLPFTAAVPVEPGWYQFEVKVGSHSSLARGMDGLAKVNPGSQGDAYNTMRVVLIEGAIFSR